MSNSDSYATDTRASDSTLDQNPGLQDSALAPATDALDRAEDREVGLGSNPGITNQAATAAHQGMDAATGEQTPSTRPNAGQGAGGDTTQDSNAGSGGMGEQVKDTVSGFVNKINENVKYS